MDRKDVDHEAIVLCRQCRRKYGGIMRAAACGTFHHRVKGHEGTTRILVNGHGTWRVDEESEAG